MASSDVPIRPKSGRRIFFLALFLVLFVGLYTVGWYYVVNRVQSAVNDALEDASQNGVALACVNLKPRGYPLRFGLRCDQLRYDDEGRNLAVSTGGFRAKAHVWNPFEITGDLDGPVVIDTPGPGGLNLTLEGLRTVVDLAKATGKPHPAGDGSSAAADPEKLLPKSIRMTLTNGALAATGPDAGVLGAVVQSETLLQAAGPDLDLQTAMKGLSVAPKLLKGRTLPLLDGQAEILVKSGMLLAIEGTQSLRGVSGELRQLALASGATAAIGLSGPFSIDKDGLLDADLILTVRDPRAVAALLSDVFPEAKQNIETGFAGMAAMGDKPSLPLRVTHGKAMLAFIPLGQIPPVQ